jgi:hypothetical protein
MKQTTLAKMQDYYINESRLSKRKRVNEAIQGTVGEFAKMKNIDAKEFSNFLKSTYDWARHAEVWTMVGFDTLEKCFADFKNRLSEFYEYRTGYEDAIRESRRISKRRVNEAISRKQKERLNLLNDIVNFAYEYGENETKTLFQQAFKKAIGDDLIESLSDEE